jgi:hypothetical protein
MQAQHTGNPFGFIPDLLPEYEGRYAPSPASVRDMMGLYMVHDGTVWPAHTRHNQLVGFLQDKRIEFPLDRMQVLHYWDDDKRAAVRPDPIKYLLHFGEKQALLILFNWSDATRVADVKLDVAALGLPAARIQVRDAITGQPIADSPGSFEVPILPRGLRMLAIGQ